MLYVDVQDIGLLTVRTLGDLPKRVDDRVTLRPRDDRVYRFDEQGRSMASAVSMA